MVETDVQLRLRHQKELTYSTWRDLVDAQRRIYVTFTSTLLTLFSGIIFGTLGLIPVQLAWSAGVAGTIVSGGLTALFALERNEGSYQHNSYELVLFKPKLQLVEARHNFERAERNYYDSLVA